MKSQAISARTIDALKKEGFGVLTEIDVRETLKKKIGPEPNHGRWLRT